ncbi:MAG: hypothetical protein C4527_19265 [Candidatus Omnitrophota bacterium]|jgi:serine/threonine protein kinase|nr:MAG: hypothetical protein C4527_19265 [Candidatus Omnitrophota bacterium]
MSSQENSIISQNDLRIVNHYLPLLRRHGLVSLDALFQSDIGISLKKPGLSQWRERFRLVLDDDRGNPRIFYLKRFHHPPPNERREVGKALHAHSVAAVEWTWMWTFLSEGIPTPQPVAFGEEIKNGVEIRSLIVTEALPGRSLETWMNRWGENDKPLIRKLINPLADLIARLHKNRFIHRDLYTCHIFFDPLAPVQNSLYLIDLQRVIKPKWWIRRWIVKDLAALNYSTPSSVVSTKDRLRWLKRYLGIPRLATKEKRLIRQIQKKTKRIARHDKKRREKLYGKFIDA